jgi:hypothetical protein
MWMRRHGSFAFAFAVVALVSGAAVVAQSIATTAQAPPAAALIDRLVHHATMITLKGKSYRLRERAAANSDTSRQRARRQELS